MRLSISSLVLYAALAPALIIDPPSPEELLYSPSSNHDNTTPSLFAFALHAIFAKRQDRTPVSTCGYASGDASRPRTAEPGFDCRVDTQHGLWGFCPTTVVNAVDCGLAGACFDNRACTSGCGILEESAVTTISCKASGGDACSTAVLIGGPDQTFRYIACAASPVTDLLLAVPTTTPSPPTPSPTKAQSTAQPAAAPPQTVTLTQAPPQPTTDDDAESESDTEPRTTPPPRQTSAVQTPLRIDPSSSSNGEAESVIQAMAGTVTITSLPSGSPQPPSNSTNSTNTNSPPLASPAAVPIGAIIGAVVGGVALLILIALAIWLVRRHKNRPPYPPPKRGEVGQGPKTHAQLALAAFGGEKDGFEVRRGPAELDAGSVRKGWRQTVFGARSVYELP